MEKPDVSKFRVHSKHTSLFCTRQLSVQTRNYTRNDPSADLIAHLVRVSLGDGLGGEEERVRSGHRASVTDREVNGVFIGVPRASDPRGRSRVRTTRVKKGTEQKRDGNVCRVACCEWRHAGRRLIGEGRMGFIGHRRCFYQYHKVLIWADKDCRWVRETRDWKTAREIRLRSWDRVRTVRRDGGPRQNVRS